MAKLGVQAIPQPNSAGWLHVSCLFAPWKHKNGIDRSKGMALKVEEHGISAYMCPVCKHKGRISGMVRTLAHYRNASEDPRYIAISEDADRFDMLGTELTPFDEAFSPIEEMPEPLDEAIFAGMFDPIGNHQDAVEFMHKRRVSKETCDKLNIEYDPDKKRIVFPVRNGKSELFGWSGRTIIPDYEPKVLDYAGLPKRALILGEERWRPKTAKLLVEGLFAYARMHEIGVEEHMDIGALLGSTMTAEKTAIVIHHGCGVFAMPDPDKAGAQCLYGQWSDETETYAGGGMIDQLAGEIPVHVPYYPQGVTDLDDITLTDLLRVLHNAPMVFPSPKTLDKKSRAR